MKHLDLKTLTENLERTFIVATGLGFLIIFFIKISFLDSISIFVYISWALLCILLYALSRHLKLKENDAFDFYKVAEPIGRQERRKKQNIEERVAIHIGEEGLDPMILFNEEKTGVACILTLTALKPTHKISRYLTELAIQAEQQGQPIAGQTLFTMNFEQQSGYFRLTEDGTNILVEFAFPESQGPLYDQVSQVIYLLLEANPLVMVTKTDVTNFQAMQKFYRYVQRLNDSNNRCVEYISYCQGTLKICNSSYVELYDCTLQSTLTSWINQDGLIRTDNVDAELSNDNVLHLMDIELPYPECRLVNIQIVKVANPMIAVKLYLTLTELKEGQLTDNTSGLTLLMKDSSIAIKRDEQFDDELISVAEYFEQKSYPKF